MQFLNVIVKRNIRPYDRSLFFPSDEPVEYVETHLDMFNLLVKLGAFKSKSQARKNWRGPKTIPLGWSEFLGIGKYRRSLHILNPSEP